MKKFVKPLVIAASVAAIAGIGAVSFAAWSAGNNNTETTTGNETGAVSVLEFDTTKPVALTTALLPIDQNVTDTDKTPVLGSVTFTIKTSEGYEKSDFKLNVAIDNIKDSTGAASTLTDGVYVSATAPTDATAATGTKVTAAGVDVEYTITDGATYTLYIWLQSGDTADMNHTFDLVYTLADGDTAA